MVSTIVAIVSTSAAGTNKPVSVLAKHRVWLQTGLVWEHPEEGLEQQEKYAIGTILYFGADGKFGLFEGTVTKEGNKMGFAEGEGHRIFSGTWVPKRGTIRVRYCLVEAAKLILPAEQQPKVPGSMEEQEISLSDLAANGIGTTELSFDGKTYEAASTLKASDLREHLRFADKSKSN